MHVSVSRHCPFKQLTDQSELTSEADFLFPDPLVHLTEILKGRGCDDVLKRSWWKEKHSWHS